MSPILNLIGATTCLCFIFYFSGGLLLSILRMKRIGRFQASIQFAAGLLLNLILNMLVPDLRISTAIGFALAAVECWRVGKSWTWGLTSFGSRLLHASCAFLILLLLLLLFLNEPLAGWDARSIWFFHAKIIYYTGNLWADGSWKHEGAYFAHLDYPKLLPLLGAQSALLAGLWNEYLPKISLFILFMPVLLMAFALVKDNKVAGLFFIALFICFHRNEFYLLSGYADGWLALYGIMALLSFTLDPDSPDSPHQRTGSLFFWGIVLQLKNEGALLGLALLAGLILLNFKELITFLRDAPGKGLIARRHAILVLAITALPTVIWGAGKQIQGLENDLQLFSRHALAVGWNRLLAPESRNLIAESVIQGNSIFIPAIGLSLLVGLAVWVCDRPRFKDYLLFGITAGLFTGGIYWVYAATPHPLVWHLESSVERTMLTPALCLGGAIFLAVWNFLKSGTREASGTGGSSNP